MSASPSTVSPRLFYHPAYWCHSCDMSIGLPPSPTPTALLCPHCHRDSLEQMDMEEPLSPPSPTYQDQFSPSAASLTPSDDNFLLNSPYLHRLIHHLTTASAAVNNPRSNPAPKSAIESLKEVTITPECDPTMLCPVCKDPFVVNSAVKVMPCTHTYHPDCIVPWLEINNSCPVCRYKLPAVEEGPAENGREGHMRFVRLDELVDDEADVYGFQSTLRHIARRHRWNDEGSIGGGSEGNLFTPTQIAEVEGGDRVPERENSVETVSSWPRWRVDEGGAGGRGNNDGDAFARI